MKNRVIEWVDQKKLRLQNSPRVYGPWKRDDYDHSYWWWDEEKRLRAFPTLPERMFNTSVALSSEYQPDDNFFKRLPFDMRRRIIVTAFGDQIIHLSLEWAPPVELPGEDEYRNPVYGPMTMSENTERDETHGILWNERCPAYWQWGSCFCRRTPAFKSERAHQNVCKSGLLNDECLEDILREPLHCRIGVMGWLLSCRQA